MGRATRELKKRKRARDKIARLMEVPEHVVVIHYSCESFHNRPEGKSPRITSIAVRNLGSGQTTSFSIHQIAEIRGLEGPALEDNFNELEREALDSFYEYVGAHTGYDWVHWNMRDINYGFQALAHRYRVLGGTAVEIPETSRFDLARGLKAIYGVEYIGHPRLANIVKRNGITDQNFLLGAEEAEAFENRDYYRLHLSTLRKVDVIANIAERVDHDTLKTNTSWTDHLRLYPQVIGEWFREHWLASLIIAALSIISFILAVIK